MIRLSNILKETELGDRVKREHALKTYEAIVEYMETNGRDALHPVGGMYSSKKQKKLYTSEIEKIPDQFDLKILFTIGEGSGPRGAFQRSGNFFGIKTTPTMKIFIDENEYEGTRTEKVIKAFKDKREVFIHEFTHYLDRKRIPSPNDLDYETGLTKGYFNDDRELNAYYQQAVGELTAQLKNNPQFLKEKLEEWDDFSEFKEWFFENILDEKFKKYVTRENEKSFIKRLYRFYDETLPNIEDNVLTDEVY